MLAERALTQPTHEFVSFQPTRVETVTCRKALAYDPIFDIEDFQTLEGLRSQVSLQEHTRPTNQLNARTRSNLETNLGERFNVQINTVNYSLENGQ